MASAKAALKLERKPDPNVIRGLESLREQARRGELRGLVLVANWGGAHECWILGAYNRAETVYAMELVKAKLFDEIFRERNT
jgi:hypothetical protein